MRRPSAPTVRPRLARVALALLALIGAGATAPAQDTTVWIDLGTDGFPSAGTAPGAWNDIDQTTLGVPLVLVDETGAPTGITWDVVSSQDFDSANSAGTSAPTPPLSTFPVSATRDVVYGSNGKTVVVELSGLAPGSFVDLVFGASRLNVTDERTTDYLVQGFNAGVGTLDPSNNTSEVATVEDILVDDQGRVTISVKAALENTNPGTHFFYLGAVKLDVTVPAEPAVALAFDTPQLAVALTQGDGPFATSVGIAESEGAATPVTFTAVDAETGLPPTWLTLPAGGTAGASATLTFDDAGQTFGVHTATVTASAPGHLPAKLDVDLDVRPPGVRNLLFYGNSYSIGNGGMPGLVASIAEALGQVEPFVVAKLTGGTDLLYHLTNPDDAAAITEALPLGQQWDTVVLQGFSTEATQIGDPAAFQANALAIVTNVRAHSPDARCVFFQTWARGPEWSGYPGIWPNPLGMHDEIRTNYRAAAQGIDAVFGAGTAEVAAAGDGVALLSFDDALYTDDWSHPEPPTTLLTAMTVYEALFDERITAQDPDFGAADDLTAWLASHGLGEADWVALSGVAERVADPALRLHPGSGELLLLETSVGSDPPDARPLSVASTGEIFHVRLSSPYAVYGEDLSHVVFDVFPTGAPPAPNPAFPEVHVKPSYFIVATSAPLGPGLPFDVVVPPAVSGLSVLVQGVALGPSAETGNPDFTTTDGHEVELR